MSRVAKNPVSIPSGVEIKLEDKMISVSGSKGKSDFTLPESVSASHADDVITISYDESSSESTATPQRPSAAQASSISSIFIFTE